MCDHLNRKVVKAHFGANLFYSGKKIECRYSVKTSADKYPYLNMIYTVICESLSEIHTALQEKLKTQALHKETDSGPFICLIADKNHSWQRYFENKHLCFVRFKRRLFKDFSKQSVRLIEPRQIPPS